ncbi:MAG TPA: hypothetical protein VJY35_11775 [Candidatus Eisenbacteria bacterium]|nr:hypothetical protein [Candidatus Eisenbacteria bacterium]
MKKAALLTGLLLVFFALIASAAGMNVYWSDCGPAGTMNRSFSCVGCSIPNSDIWTSFDPPQPVPQLTGTSQLIDLQSATATLPDWWQFKNPGSCRQFGLSALSSFGPGSCFDTWGGFDLAAVDAYLVTANTPGMQPNRARILSSTAVPDENATSVIPGTEYFSMILRVNAAKTVGSGACAGCSTPICLVLTSLALTDINATTLSITNPLNNNFITFHGGAVPGGCPGAVPAVNRTWGQVKSIYR